MHRAAVDLNVTAGVDRFYALVVRANLVILAADVVIIPILPSAGYLGLHSNVVVEKMSLQ